MERIKKYSAEELKSQSIMYLRQLGMMAGVRLPTTLRKADLIKEILAIQNGEKQPYIKKKTGRKITTLGKAVKRIEKIRIEKLCLMKMYEFQFHIQHLKKLLNAADKEILIKKIAEAIDMM